MQELAKQLLQPEQDLAIIDAIHEDFDSAGQQLLDKAQEILSEEQKKMEDSVYGALKDFGFKRSQAVVEHESMAKAQKMAQQVAEKVTYYLAKYPDNKFITREQVKDICKKYGLAFGKTEWFTGDIPDKNKLDIARFKLDEKDANGKDYMIVATKDEFDTQGRTLKNGWELKELPKDPIVLAPVHGGYLIVTVWGPEADIDEVK